VGQLITTSPFEEAERVFDTFLNKLMAFATKVCTSSVELDV